MKNLSRSVSLSLYRDISFSAEDFGEENVSLLKDALSFPYPGRDKIIQEKLPGWMSIPRTLTVLREADGRVRVPRGTKNILEHGMELLAIRYLWIDQRVDYFIDTSSWKEIILRDYQEDAVETILKETQGIYRAPTGAGKSEVVLEAIRRSNQKSLVIVDKLSLAQQWKERAEEHLGIEVGIVGEGKQDFSKPITIGMQQTLWSYRDEFQSEFYNFGFVCADEVHHVESRTLMDMMQRFPARYMIGVSATPDRREDVWPFVQAVIGEIICETPDEEVIDGGYVLKPRVEVVDTNFQFDYIQTHDYADCPGSECKFYGRMTKAGTPWRNHRNNYQDLLDELENDEDRNHLIAATACFLGWQEERTQLVVSRRLKHLDLLLTECREASYPPDLLHRLTGKEGAEERTQVYESARPGAIIFSTIANEALDIPRLDTIHLAFPGKNPKVVQQQVGRICRPHPDKQDALVVDYVDSKQTVLRIQYYARKRGFYDEKGLDIRRERIENGCSGS